MALGIGGLGCGSVGDAQAPPLAREEAIVSGVTTAAQRSEPPAEQPAPSRRLSVTAVRANPPAIQGAAALSDLPAAVADEVGIRALPLDATQLRQLLASIPTLAPLASDFKALSNADADAALRKGGRSRIGLQLFTFLPSAAAWVPTKGKEWWVLSGRSGARTVVAVLRALGAGRFAHAASTFIDEPNATVAIGYSAEHPEQLMWTTCYGCAGEGGTIRVRDDGRVEFTYR